MNALHLALRRGVEMLDQRLDLFARERFAEARWMSCRSACFDDPRLAGLGDAHERAQRGQVQLLFLGDDAQEEVDRADVGDLPDRLEHRLAQRLLRVQRQDRPAARRGRRSRRALRRRGTSARGRRARAATRMRCGSAVASRYLPSEETIDEATLMSVSLSSSSRRISKPSRLRRSPRRLTSERRTSMSCSRAQPRRRSARMAGSPIRISASVDGIALAGVLRHRRARRAVRRRSPARASRTRPSTMVLRTRQSLSPRSSNMSGRLRSSVDCATRNAAFCRASGSAERACSMICGSAVMFGCSCGWQLRRLARPPLHRTHCVRLQSPALRASSARTAAGSRCRSRCRGGRACGTRES